MADSSLFLTEPRPERFEKISDFAGGADMRFAVGVKIIAADGRGLKIVPTAHVVFALDDKEIDLPPGMIRDLVPRLQEMCDAAQKLNQHAPTY